MSKNVIVQDIEGNMILRSNISHIITDIQGGETCTWIPLDEVENTDIRVVYENGLYSSQILLSDGDNISF